MKFIGTALTQNNALKLYSCNLLFILLELSSIFQQNDYGFVYCVIKNQVEYLKVERICHFLRGLCHNLFDCYCLVGFSGIHV